MGGDEDRENKSHGSYRVVGKDTVKWTERMGWENVCWEH